MAHNMNGHSVMFDNIRRVLLTNSIALEIDKEEARILIGFFGGEEDEREPELVRFARPAVVSAFSILAQVIEDEGRKLVGDASKSTRTWHVCPECQLEGGMDDRDGNWLDCEACAGTGVIRVARES